MKETNNFASKKKKKKKRMSTFHQTLPFMQYLDVSMITNG